MTAARDTAIEAVREILLAQDLLACTRDWSAWSHGTMGEDDFARAGEDDEVVAEIADAMLVALAAQALAGDPGPCMSVSPPITGGAVGHGWNCELRHGHEGGHEAGEARW